MLFISASAPRSFASTGESYYDGGGGVGEGVGDRDVYIYIYIF